MTLCLNQLLRQLNEAKASLDMYCKGVSSHGAHDCDTRLDEAIAAIEASFPTVNYKVTWHTSVLAKSAREAVATASARMMGHDRHFVVEWEACGPNKIIVGADGKEVDSRKL